MAISSIRHLDVARQILNDGTLVRVLVGNVEIVGLRSRRRRALSERSLGICLAALHLVVIVADADDLGDVVKLFTDIRHDLRLEFHRPSLAGDMRGVGLRNQPVIAAVDPGVEAMLANKIDRLARHIDRYRLLLEDREIPLPRRARR